MAKFIRLDSNRCAAMTNYVDTFLFMYMYIFLDLVSATFATVLWQLNEIPKP